MSLTALSPIQKRIIVGVWQTESRWRPNATLECIFIDPAPKHSPRQLRLSSFVWLALVGCLLAWWA
jgi:hypothetical protein